MSNGHIPPVRNPGPPTVDWSNGDTGEVDLTKVEGASEKTEKGERPGLLDGDIPELLPSEWLTSSHRERFMHIAALAQRKLDITGDRGGQKLREFLSRQGFKKLSELPDDIFAQSSALVFVALLPVIQYAADINWNRIAEITREQLAKVSGADLSDVAPGWRQFPAPGYERLHAVYQDAHHQAAYGKGNERHANDLPFHKQRMQTISQGLNSPDGMAYQVIKKLQEGLQMEDPGARRRELLGALNYLAGIVIFLDDREAGGDV